VTYVLEPIANGTRLTLSHTGFIDPASCESHGEGWTHVLEWLAAYVRPPTAYYFLRLVPPRTTFPADATPAELAAMAKHATYWRAKIDAGVGVVAGPVADPAGAWGLGVIAASDEVELRAFIADDPAISAGLGFRYEQMRMMTAIR
ncbi:MAG TPA: YciI family protein, partial [Kofleriaceae bacterium]